MNSPISIMPNIQDMVNEWLLNCMKEFITFFVSLFSGLLDTLDSDIFVIDVWGVVFTGFAGMLLVCIVLFRVVSTVFNAAYGSEVSAARIVLDTVKAGAAIPVMAVAQLILQSLIIFPLLKYFFSAQGSFTAEALTETTSVAGIELTGIVLVLFLLFFAVVLGVFFVKMSRFYVDIMFFNLAAPFVAISIASEQSDFAKSWWQSLLKLNLTLLSQVLSLTLLIIGITNLGSGLHYLMLCIGGGILVISPPMVLQELWASSGTARGLGRAISRIATDMRQRSLFKGSN